MTLNDVAEKYPGWFKVPTLNITLSPDHSSEGVIFQSINSKNWINGILTEEEFADSYNKYFNLKALKDALNQVD